MLAAVGAPVARTATPAAGILVQGGVPQVFLLYAVWMSYRAVSEALRARACRYAAEVGPYADPSSRRARPGRA